jgi:hypothetical protein
MAQGPTQNTKETEQLEWLTGDIEDLRKRPGYDPNFYNDISHSDYDENWHQ